jgi:hypothetical protein
VSRVGATWTICFSLFLPLIERTILSVHRTIMLRTGAVIVNPLGAFKSDPEKKLARDLAAVRSIRDKLSERLRATELAISERRAEAQRLARDGANDSELDAAEAALRSAQDRRATLAAALFDVERQVQELERAHDDLADKKLRAETAATVEKLVLEVAEAAAAFDAGAEKLAECTGRAAAIVADARGLEIFATHARAEVHAAIAMTTALLRSRASEVLKGNAPAKLPKPEAPMRSNVRQWRFQRGIFLPSNI